MCASQDHLTDRPSTIAECGTRPPKMPEELLLLPSHVRAGALSAAEVQRPSGAVLGSGWTRRNRGGRKARVEDYRSSWNMKIRED